MNAANASYRPAPHPASVDFSDNLLALPSCGGLIARLKAAFGHWAHTSVEAQADGRLWSAPSRDTRRQTATLWRATGKEGPTLSGRPSLTVASDRKPLNDGWDQIVEHAYQTRFHSNGAQLA